MHIERWEVKGVVADESIWILVLELIDLPDVQEFITLQASE